MCVRETERDSEGAERERESETGRERQGGSGVVAVRKRERGTKHTALSCGCGHLSKELKTMPSCPGSAFFAYTERKWHEILNFKYSFMYSEGIPSMS